MNKEQKVISQSLAKKIHDKAKEKGFKLPESSFGWYQKYLNEVWGIGDMAEVMNDARMIGEATAPQWEYYPAFDCAELGEMLLDNVESYHRYDRWTCGEHRMNHWESAETMAEAMGKMFYYLLDNDLLK